MSDINQFPESESDRQSSAFDVGWPRMFYRHACDHPQANSLLPSTKLLAPTTNQPALLLVGQTPPPWHGQAVGTNLLFDHDWGMREVTTLRMAYSDEMHSVGRFE